MDDNNSGTTPVDTSTQPAQQPKGSGKYAYISDPKTGEVHAVDYTQYGLRKADSDAKGFKQVIPLINQDTGARKFLDADVYSNNVNDIAKKGFVREDQGYQFKPSKPPVSDTDKYKQQYKELFPDSPVASTAVDLLTGFANDVALGIPKAAVAGGTALVNKLQGDQGSFSDLYGKEFNKFSAYSDAAKERSPIAGNAGSVAGMFAAPVPEAGAITSTIAEVAGKLGMSAERLLQLAKESPRIAAMLETGASAGAMGGLSTGIQSQGDLGAVGKSAALGAGLGAGGAGLLSGISGVRQYLQKNTLAANPATKAAMGEAGLPQFVEQQTPQGVKGALGAIEENVGQAGKTADQITQEKIVNPANLKKGLASVEAGETALSAKQSVNNYKDLSKQLKDTIESDTSHSVEQTRDKLENAKQIADFMKSRYGTERDYIFNGKLSSQDNLLDPKDVSKIITDSTDASSPAFIKAYSLFENKYAPRIQSAKNQGEALRAVDDFQKEIGQGIYMNLADGSVRKVPNALLKGLKSNLTDYVTNNSGEFADDFRKLQKSYTDASAISNIVDATKIKGLQAFPGGAINSFGKIPNISKLEKFLENQPLTEGEAGGKNILEALGKYSPDTARSLLEAQQMVRNPQKAYTSEAQALAEQTQAAQKSAEELRSAALENKGEALGATKTALQTAANPLESDYYSQLPDVQQRLLKTMDELKQAKLSGKNLNFSDQMHHILQNSKEYANVAPDIVNDIEKYAKYEPVIKDVLNRVPKQEQANVLGILEKVPGLDKVVKYLTPKTGLEGLSELSKLQRAPQEQEKYNKIISLLSQAGASKLNKNNPGTQ